MAKLSFNQIKEAARALLEGAPQGLRRSELVKAVHAQGPETPLNTVGGAIQNLVSTANDIERASRGVWILKKHADAAQLAVIGSANGLNTSGPTSPKKSAQFSEEVFYQPFSEWLREEAEEVVESMSLGGGVF